MARQLITSIFRSRFLPFVLLFLLPVFIFYKATLGTDVFALGDFSGSDLLELHLPFKYILHDAYTRGEFPLWTPYLANGFPILAEGQSGPLYPPHILLAFIQPYLALNYSILLAFIVAGWGMYIFARQLPRMSRYGAFMCAVVFMFSSFFVARLKHLNMIVVAAYLPLTLWAIKRSLDLVPEATTVRIRLKFYLILAFIWCLQILGGHPHMFYFCVIMSFWFLCGEILYLYFKGARNISSVIFLSVTGFIVAGVISGLLGAAQLLPTIELTQYSSRLNYTFENATSFPLRPSYLASLFAPFFLGNPATGSYKGNIQVDGIWWENVLYVGLFPFVLFIIAFIVRLKSVASYFSRPGRGRLFSKLRSYLQGDLFYYWFFFISAILFLLLAMGDYTSLFSFVYYTIPGMQLFRFPTRFNLFTLLSLAVLTGYALDWMLQRLERSRVAGMHKKETSDDYVFSWPFSLYITRILFFAVILVDLVVFIYQYVGFFPLQKYLSTPDSLRDLQKDTSYYRIYPTSQYVSNPFKELGWKRGEESIYSLQKALPGNFPAVYKQFSFTDRGWFEGGLGLAERHALEKVMTENGVPVEVLSRILGLWNVKYFIGFSGTENDYFKPYASYALDKSFLAPLEIQENVFVMPRAYITQQIKKVASQDHVYESLLDESFNPYQYAVSTKEGRAVISTNSASLAEPSDVEITKYSALQVAMRSSSQHEGFIVFSDTHYPGWNVYVDAVNKPISQVNLLQRAVKIDKGNHMVLWIYEPLSFYIGLCVSVATCVCCGILFIKKKGEW